jgi:hypothetical protein
VRHGWSRRPHRLTLRTREYPMRCAEPLSAAATRAVAGFPQSRPR